MKAAAAAQPEPGRPSQDTGFEAAAPAGAILVIKLGALGDVVMALGPLAAIRRHHPGGRLVVLTTAPYADLIRGSGLADEVWVDPRARWWQARPLLALRQRLRGAGFARVYDLQTNDRTALYFRLLGPGRRPEWSGVAPGCSHPHRNPKRKSLHAFDRLGEQLSQAGIGFVPPPDIAFLDAPVDQFALPVPYALLVPGCSPHRPEKRWPVTGFAALARRLMERGICPVLLGTRAESEITSEIMQLSPGAVDLTGQTGLGELAALARAAAGAVGNDTGPMHVISLTGCPSLALFGGASDPNRNAPLGPDVGVLRRDPLEALGVDTVDAALRLRPQAFTSA